MDPGSQAQPLVGQALQALQAGEWARAEQLAAQAVAAAPHDPLAQNAYGAALHAAGRDDRAIKAYRKSISLAPGHADSWLQLALLYSAARRHGDAAPCFEKAIGLGACTADAFLGLATAHACIDRLDAALAPAREAARLASGSAPAAALAARCELEVGDLDASLGGFARLSSLAPPADRWRFARAIAWPPMVDSREQIARRFEEVDHALDELVAHPAAIADPLHEVGLTGFYMAYQGFDDTGLQRKIAQAYRLASPGLEWTAPHVSRARDTSAPIRIGFLSRFLNNHTIGKLNIGIAQKLDPQRFEVFVLRPPCEPDFLAGAFDQAARASVTLPFDLAAARAMVAQAELDVLFYPDIGMDPFTYYLAFARLAPLQFTTWGHPVTTGIPNVDCFLSARHAEPGGAQRFYTERLAMIDSPPSFYYRPRPPTPFDLRAHLGLGTGERIYASMQTLYKMHPDFDDALVEILRRDPQGRVVLIAAKRNGWNDKLRNRLRRAGPDVFDRVVFMPPVSLPDYLASLTQADALIDTFHFGGGCSSYESFGMAAPVVTLPGERMRSRITAALYARMGQSRWIARSADDFVRLAIELAHGTGEQKRRWKDEIAAGAGAFLENDAVIREYEQFIETALSDAAA